MAKLCAAQKSVLRQEHKKGARWFEDLSEAIVDQLYRLKMNEQMKYLVNTYLDELTKVNKL